MRSQLVKLSEPLWRVNLVISPPTTAKPRYNHSPKVHGQIIMMFAIYSFICVLALLFSAWALYKGLESKKEYARLKSETPTPPKEDE